MSNIFESSHPLVAHKLAHLREKDTEPRKFRELIREISALLAYEATADLDVAPRTVQTPLGDAPGKDLQQNIGLVPILRSGFHCQDSCIQVSGSTWVGDRILPIPITNYLKLH